MKEKLLGVVAACGLAVSISQATADTFAISGTYTQSPFLCPVGPCSVTGSITIVGNEVVAATLSTTLGTYTMPGAFNPGPYSGTFVTLDHPHVNGSPISCLTTDGFGCHDHAVLNLSDTPATLVANNGGFFNGDAECEDCGIGVVDIFSGVIGTPSPVPLPAALPLFATGLGALGLLGWRRKRKAIGATV